MRQAFKWVKEISIYASREGSDKLAFIIGKYHNISIHASREGSDDTPILGSVLPFPFQSTLPAREATMLLLNLKLSGIISIHASREGSDGTTEQQFQEYLRFQSTLPAREATSSGRACAACRTISIHASREGSDCLFLCYFCGL